MSDLNSAVLALLGAGGLTGFGALVLRAFLQALRATAAIQARQEKEIERLTATTGRQDDEIEALQLKLLAAHREAVEKSIEADRQMAENVRLEAKIVRLQVEVARLTGTASSGP